MGSAHVCASCRQHLLHNLRVQGGRISSHKRWPQVQASSSQTSVSFPQSRGTSRSHSTSSSAGDTHENDPNPQPARLQLAFRARSSSNVEDEFLQRIFRGRAPTRDAGPYSRPQKDENKAQRANDTSGPSISIPRSTPNAALTDLFAANGRLKHGRTDTLSVQEDHSRQREPLSTVEEGVKRKIYPEIDSVNRTTGHRGSEQPGLEAALFEKIGSKRLGSPAASEQRTPSDDLGKYESAREAWFKKWQIKTWSCLKMLLQSISSDQRKSVEAGLLKASQDELIHMWNSLLQREGSCHLRPSNGQYTPTAKPVTSWKLFNMSEEMQSIKQKKVTGLHARLASFFRNMRESEISELATLVMSTYVVLRHHYGDLAGNSRLAKERAQLLNFCARLCLYSDALQTLPVYIQRLRNEFGETAELAFLETQISKSFEEMEIFVIAWKNEHEKQPKGDSTSTAEQAFKSRVGRAVEQGEGQKLEQVWSEAERYYLRNKDKSEVEHTMPRAVYRSFISGFMALRRPNRALDAWNTMLRNGVAPQAAEWDAMLKGCSMAKDHQSLSIMWGQMIASGLKPDAQLWMTMIHGLTRSGHWKSGIDTFNAMVQNWTSAAVTSKEYAANPDLAALGDIGDVPKPNIIILNSLVEGLSRGRKYEHLPVALQQAKTLGIHPNTYTFNPIIRSALKDENPELMMRLLDYMQSTGVKPDVATFTMVIRSIYSSEFDSPSSTALSGSTNGAQGFQTQQAAVEALFDIMNRSGIQANAHTFTVIISGILGQGESRSPSGHQGSPHSSYGRLTPQQVLSAAYSVLEQMRTLGIRIPTRIYTMLISYHFHTASFEGLKSPNLAAVEALWIQARSPSSPGAASSTENSTSPDSSAVGADSAGSNASNNSATLKPKPHLDNVFYDRLIEGFARFGEIGRMMTALTHASRQGKWTSWPALTEVVRALVVAQDWTRAREVVESIRAHEQAIMSAQRDQVRLATGKRDFWALVEAANLGTEHAAPGVRETTD